MAVNHAGNRDFLVERPEQFKMGQIDLVIEGDLGEEWPFRREATKSKENCPNRSALYGLKQNLAG